MKPDDELGIGQEKYKNFGLPKAKITMCYNKQTFFL